MNTATVSDLMTRKGLRTIGPETLVFEATGMVEGASISHLLVTDGEALVGVVCVCDLMQMHARTRVSACMSERVVTIEPDANVATAAKLMLDHGVHCLPVVTGATLRGILTMGDLRRGGVTDLPADTCASCGSLDHVRSEMPGAAGYCLDCTRRSAPFGHDPGGG